MIREEGREGRQAEDRSGLRYKGVNQRRYQRTNPACQRVRNCCFLLLTMGREGGREERRWSNGEGRKRIGGVRVGEGRSTGKEGR